jgi:hypothetical protein
MPSRNGLTYHVEEVRPCGPIQSGPPPGPLPARTGPDHPRMGRSPNSLHEDCYASDVSPHAGPHGANVRIQYFKNDARFGGLCPTFVFDSHGRLLTPTYTAGKAFLLCFEPGSLDVRDVIEIPGRDVKVKTFFQGGFNKIFKDTSGGAYFFVDKQDRAVIPTTEDTIWIVDRQGPMFRRVACVIDVREALRQRASDDKLTATLPVWQSNGPDFYWFTSRQGIVGVASEATRRTAAFYDLRLQGWDVSKADEEIQNSFAVNAKGCFVVTNYALYRLAFDGRRVERVWRAPYCRLDSPKCPTCPDNDPPSRKKPKLKPGQIDFGSGTTPTLLGDKYVVICDGQRTLNVCVYDQDTGALLSRMPLFREKGGACENSPIVHDGGILVGNTYGYVHPLHHLLAKESGVARVNMDSGSGALSSSWYDPKLEVMSSPPKLSRGNGYVYSYSMKKTSAVQRRWSVLAFDYKTGKVGYEVPVFEGAKVEFDNAWGSLTIGPDRALYIAMWKGFLRVRDA